MLRLFQGIHKEVLQWVRDKRKGTSTAIFFLTFSCSHYVKCRQSIRNVHPNLVLDEGQVGTFI